MRKQSKRYKAKISKEFKALRDTIKKDPEYPAPNNLIRHRTEKFIWKNEVIGSFVFIVEEDFFI